MIFNIKLTAVERTTVVAALINYGAEDFASDILLRSAIPPDPAEDGPEVDILREKP